NGPTPALAYLCNGPNDSVLDDQLATDDIKGFGVVDLSHFPMVPFGGDLNSNGAFFFLINSPPLLQPVEFDFHITYQVLSDPLDDPKNTPEIGVMLIPLPQGISTTTGIPDALEAAGPNGGDGNGDHIQDNQQNNVVSLPGAVPAPPTTDSSYVTLTTLDPVHALPPGPAVLAGVSAQGNPSPSDAPANVNFP